MKKKYYILGTFFIFSICFFLYQLTHYLGTSVINYIEYSKVEYEISSDVISLETDGDTIGKVYIKKEGNNSYIYLVYDFGIVSGKPEIVSAVKKGKDLYIKIKPAIKSKSRIGLTTNSYHHFKIEIKEEIDDVILKEIK